IYIDEYGSDRRVTAAGDVFTIGRHSENDLCIPDPGLSRDHIRIEREGDAFKIRDMGSSNGTELNGTRLHEPAHLNDGDVVTLGGAVALRVEIKKEAPRAAPPLEVRVESRTKKAPPPAAQNISGGTSSGIPLPFLIAAPIIGVLVVIFSIAAIYLLNSPGSTNARSGDDIEFDDDEPITPRGDDRKVKDGPTPTRTADAIPVTEASPSNSTGSDSTSSPTATTGLQAVEENAALFMRRIAHNDPRAFITAEHANLLDAKIKQVAASPALAANIDSAASGSARITALAREHNLKPQFVAVAAIAHMGGRSGDPAKTAESMIATLGKLSTHLGTEFGEDALLVIAAYKQGEANEFLKMRNMLQSLSNQHPESTRMIRTIWFLQQNQKITPAEFDAALTFLAVGAITQNPKAFGVNAKALQL
ncbi:MAG TPA: FHA domain-containing protein, partial [Pyrinomonadaceae bacterium]|nr:FHA domain-containing protein [Pyrinomonadaceae bacterium]